MARPGRFAAAVLAACCAWAAPLRAEQSPSQESPIQKGIVELVLADSESQARVVARAMRTGFFVDQLLIPETTYVGRRGFSQLPPGVQGALEDGIPGRPYLLTGSRGKLLVARVLQPGPPAILGETEYATDREAIWAVLSVGPTDLRLLSLEVDEETGTWPPSAGGSGG